jgi:hypothetical protein
MIYLIARAALFDSHVRASRDDLFVAPHAGVLNACVALSANVGRSLEAA